MILASWAMSCAISERFGMCRADAYGPSLRRWPYITAAYWFIALTSFANPAVTIARALSDTYAGIAPAGVIAFFVAQLVGAGAAVGLAQWLWPHLKHGTAATERQ
jgi:hypothetical protein